VDHSFEFESRNKIRWKRFGECDAGSLDEDSRSSCSVWKLNLASMTAVADRSNVSD
jgi:hypothetical protein